MGYILLSTFGLGMLFAAIGAFIKFLQWVLFDITFGIFFKFPTMEANIRFILIFAGIGAVLGFINGIIEMTKVIGSNDNGKKIWIEDDILGIYYDILPPGFCNIDSNDNMFICCGMCKNYDSEKGCIKYGVVCHGVGSSAKTKCNDFVSALGE